MEGKGEGRHATQYTTTTNNTQWPPGMGKATAIGVMPMSLDQSRLLPSPVNKRQVGGGWDATCLFWVGRHGRTDISGNARDTSFPFCSRQVGNERTGKPRNNVSRKMLHVKFSSWRGSSDGEHHWTERAAGDDTQSNTYLGLKGPVSIPCMVMGDPMWHPAVRRPEGIIPKRHGSTGPVQIKTPHAGDPSPKAWGALISAYSLSTNCPGTSPRMVSGGVRQGGRGYWGS